MAEKKIKILIVDDSASIRLALGEILASDPELEVVGMAVDPHDAREKIKQLNPDVLTLDIEMPKMDGITFLERLMALRPMPVVMVSSLTQKNSQETLRALEIGAVDYVSKPDKFNGHALKAYAQELCTKVKAAAKSNVKRSKDYSPAAQKAATAILPYHGNSIRPLIAIGASTGGVEAIKEILTRLPANSPAIVITQHMPAGFTQSFAERMDSLCEISVHEAKNLQEIKPGNAYIAPGGYHLEIGDVGGVLKCHIRDTAPVSGHKPSVDAMFRSLANCCPKRCVAVILTGMGRDGADGLLALRQAGALTLGQDALSCVVYGMPKAAYENGAVQTQISLKDAAETILKQGTSL